MLRYASLEERQKFYKEEFDLYKARSFLESIDVKIKNKFAIRLGYFTKIYLQKFKDIAETPMYIVIKASSLEELRDVLLYYLPESVYYFRSFHLLDFDPHRIKCSCGIVHKKPDFCIEQFEKLKLQVHSFVKELEKLSAEYRIVFSGRGFHIYVFNSSRRKLETLAKNYPVDLHVIRQKLARLPFSLNALTTRIVTPIDRDDLLSFDINDRSVVPSFLRKLQKSVPSSL